MPAAKNPSVRPVPAITTAAAKTRSAIEGLQAKLATDQRSESSAAGSGAAGSASALKSPDNIEHRETEEDLESQLQAYFERAAPDSASGTAAAHVSRTEILEELRGRVIDGVVNRILAEWTRPGASPAGSLGRQVMERLIERVLEQLPGAS